MASAVTVTPFTRDGVRGVLHQPDTPAETGMVLTHGAGSNCDAPLLIAVANAFCGAGMAVLRCDLAFRQRRPKGPPSPSTSSADRAGLRSAADALREIVRGQIILAGHSYGGRQASMLAADEPGVAAALLLLSYPLHPPEKPAQLRTGHFPKLSVPAVFVHGTKDPFGTIEELRTAATLIPTAPRIIPVERAGHDLKRGHFDLGRVVVALNQRGSASAK